MDVARGRLIELEQMAADGALWNDAAKAKAVMQEKRRLELNLGSYDGLRRRLDDAVTLLELGEAEDDAGVMAEGDRDLQVVLAEAKKMEVQCLLGGEVDGNNAYIEIHAGAGGTESCDWAGMLLRMYSRWAERQGFKVILVDEQSGDQAGVKSATIQVVGDFAYGLAKTEGGIHRLVRISPFDSNARRHTSFASVYVYPEIDDDIEININPADLKIDTLRSSGAGGQHVNKTESAIRMTHIPTGISVYCQQDRSQHRNRDIALKILKSRLYEHERQKKDVERAAVEAGKTEIGWGHQIRSYVLQPYQMVKDLRTGVETSNTTAVLDGDIDAFIQAALADKVGNKRTD